MEGFGSAKVPKPRPVDRDKMHLCSMIRLISMGMAMCLGLGALKAQTAARSEQPQPFDRPLNAENAWPSGTFGVDYNVADQEGFRHSSWVRVYPDGALYYSGTFDHGLPVGSWWFFRENGTALSHVIHDDDDPTASRVSTYAPDGRITAQGGYLHGTTRLRDEVLAERPEPPVRHGAWSLFSSSGNLTALMHYDHGKKHGLEERYLPSGATCERGNHVEGELDGEWLAWHDNGMLRQRITYRNGILDGPFQAFYGGGGRMSGNTSTARRKEAGNSTSKTADSNTFIDTEPAPCSKPSASTALSWTGMERSARPTNGLTGTRNWTVPFGNGTTKAGLSLRRSRTQKRTNKCSDAS